MKRFFLPILALLIILPTACTEKESDLGIEMQDPSVLYDGTRCTFTPTGATLYDDSLATIGYTSAIFGDYSDPTFGTVTAIAYTQVTLPNSTGISFSEDAVIDSVTMTLVIDTLRSDTPDSPSHDLHIIVNKLPEAITADSQYYSHCLLAESDTCLYDGTVTYAKDSVVLRLREEAYPVLRQSCSVSEFLTRTKGLAIKMEAGSQTLATINFAATATRITMYYHTATVSALTYVFTINSDAAHCMSYRHDYTGTPIASLADHSQSQLDGGSNLYLEPLGGTKVRLNMQAFLDTFCVKHPTAVIHYAELVMPVSDPDASQRCERLLAYKRAADGTFALATDGNYVSNPYTYGGFDGYYDAQRHSYRLRITRHLQELLRSGKDYGTDIYIDGRRSTAFSTILNGYASGDGPRIEMVYTE